MKKILLALLASILLCSAAQAATISRSGDPTSLQSAFATGEQPKASKFNSQFDTVYNEVNAKETRLTTLEGYYSGGLLGITHGGTGLSSIASGKLLYASGSNVLAPLTLGSNFLISGGTLSVIDSTLTLGSIGGTLPASKGGTGVAGGYTDGQLLIGNTSTGNLNAASLTAGSGITITNGGGSITIAQTGAGNVFPQGYVSAATPVYASSTTFTESAFAARNSTNTADIIKSSSTTVDFATTGLNGIAQSSALVGTVSTMPALTISAVNSSTEVITFSGSHGMVTQQPIVFKGTVPAGVSVGTVYYVNNQGSTTIILYDTAAHAQTGSATGKIDLTNTTTGATTDTTYVIGLSTTFNTSGANKLQVGDVIAVTGGESRRISTVSSDTQVLLESGTTTSTSGVTYKRGGKAPNTFYYSYWATDGSTPGIVETTRNTSAGDTLVDFPTGYTSTRMISLAVRLDSSSAIIPFSVGQGWPKNPYISYLVNYTDFSGPTAGDTNVLSAGTQTVFTAVTNTYIPPISTVARLWVRGLYTSTAQSIFLRQTGSAVTKGFELRTNVAEVFPGVIIDMPLNTSQQFDYKLSGANSSVYVDDMGFTVTQVTDTN